MTFRLHRQVNLHKSRLETQNYTEGHLTYKSKIGSSQVFTIDGTVSNARIKIKLRIRAPTGGEEVKTSVCEMDKEYFSAKFIVDFLEAGDYDFILEYSLIDREGTQWSTKNAKEFKYTASNKRRF